MTAPGNEPAAFRSGLIDALLAAREAERRLMADLVARTLLRQALPEEESLRAFALTDDDLVALRDEIPALAVTDR